MPQVLHGRDPKSLQVIEVEIEDGLITAVRPSARSSDLWLTPGFVDLQVNGYDRIDLNDDDCSPQSVVALALRLAALGTTTFLPTIITASSAKIERLLQVVQEARRIDSQAHHAIPFVHLEGPSISPLEGYRGAHDKEYVRPPSVSEFEHWQAMSDGLIGMVTLSPHWPGSMEFIRALRKRGVLVSIGHTHATVDEIRAAVDAGALLSTHLGNGISPVLPRHPNPIWTQLAEDRLTATFIADGVHLPSEALRAMLRAKEIHRSILVSDAVALAGSPVGEYKTNVGGTVVVAQDGSIRSKESGLLAGSGITLKDAVARAVLDGRVSLGSAVRMATENPGGYAAGRGVLRPGEPADLVRFRWTQGDRTVEIADVYVMGEAVTELKARRKDA
jgi:N-acetylglucosamine-6-phosphate deacetylase